jgi:hypothetical protein
LACLVRRNVEKIKEGGKMHRSVKWGLLFLLVPVSFCLSQPKFTFGPYVGYSTPLGDYSGSTIEYYSGLRYGLSGSVNFGAVFKLKFPRINARASLFYSSLDNSGNSEPGKNDLINVKHNLFMIGLGPEFMFSFAGSRAKPFINVDLLFTTFSGETTFNNVSRVPTGTFAMSSATRTGLGFGGGVNFELSPKYSLEFLLRFNLHNLFGKTFTSGADNRLTSYIALNDDRDPLYDPDDEKHPIGTNRSISSLQINFGFLFDL